MLLRTKILLGLGAGAGAVALGRKIYLDSLPHDDHRADNMVGDSFGGNRAPVEEVAALAASREPRRVLPTPARLTTGGRAAGRYAGPPGVLKVKILKPDCEISYNKKHYKGTGLAARFKVGEVINWRKGNDIMQWYAWDGPETKGQNAKGEDYKLVHITGSFWIKYLGLSEYVAKQKKLGRHPPLQEVEDWDRQYSPLYGAQVPWGVTPPPRPNPADILGFMPGKSSGAAESNAESYLLSRGYRFVELEQGQTAKLDLNPGWYQIIANPVWQSVDKGWRYLRGYWHWTKKGPRGKSGNDQWDKFENHKCTNKLTQFYRIVEQDRWGDISSLVEVKSGKTQSVKVQPLVNLSITNRSTKKNGYSRSFNFVCNAYTVGEAYFYNETGASGKLIWWLVEKFFGKMIQIQS